MDHATSKRLERLCNAVGFVTLIWAQIDTNLDFCNVNLRDANGYAPGWKELARTRLGEKLKFAHDHIAASPLSEPVKAEGLDIVEQIQLLSEERHWLIHGASDAISSPDIIVLTRTHLKGDPQIEKRQTTLGDISLLGDASMALKIRLGRFILHGLMGLSEDDLHKLRREIAVGSV